MRHLIFLLLLCSSFATGANDISDRSRVAQLEAVEKSLLQSEASATVVGREVVLAYERIFPKKVRQEILASQDRNSLLELFAAADLVEFYTGNPSFADHMRAAFDALEKIGAPQHPLRMYEAYISSEQFSNIQELLKQYPTLEAEPPPILIGDTSREPGKKIWTVNFNNNEVRQRNFVLPQGLYIIVMFEPQCHFSENAATAMELDEKLKGLTTDKISWLARIDRNFGISEVRRWNYRHPDFPVTIASDINNWTELDSWGSPTFYFFNDGVLVKKLRGWPSDDRKNEIMELIERYSTGPKEFPGDAKLNSYGR
jgi:hypothetical protein